MIEPTVKIEMFPSWLWRWNFCAIWSDGLFMRSTKSTFGFGRTLAKAHRLAQNARHS